MKNKILKFALTAAVVTVGFIGHAHADYPPITEVFEPDASKYPADKFAKVAVVQWATPGSILPGPQATPEYAERVKQTARETLEKYIREAAGKGAKLVITPEFGTLAFPDIPDKPSEEDEFQSREEIQPYVETGDGKTTQYFQALAKELKIYIHVGFAEVDPKTTNYHNTIVAIDPTGTVVMKYRKVNLFELETQFLVPGDQPGMYTAPWGKVGIIICSDVYGTFPMNVYRQSQVDVLALSTSWSSKTPGIGQFKSAARDLHAYFLAANQVYFPDSGVLNPDGSEQSHIRQSIGVAYGYLPYKTAPSAAAKPTSKLKATITKK